MLFLAGKGDNTIGFHEVNERDPILTEGLRWAEIWILHNVSIFLIVVISMIIGTRVNKAKVLV